MKVFRFYASMMCILSVFAFVGTSCEEEDEKELQKFTVTFDSQGGSEVDSQTVAAGERLIELRLKKEPLLRGGSKRQLVPLPGTSIKTW